MSWLPADIRRVMRDYDAAFGPGAAMRAAAAGMFATAAFWALAAAFLIMIGE